MRATLDREVRDIMHYGVITVSETTSTEDICRIMSDNRVSCVGVDNGREIVGVVSTTDILVCGGRCMQRGTQAGPWALAEALMNKPMVTVDAGDPVQLAIDLMVERHIHRVLVRGDGRIIGVLSCSDVVREIGKTVSGTPEAIISHMERFEAGLKGSGETDVARETVYDVMTHGVVMVPMTQTVRETAKVLSEKRIHRAVVIDDAGEMIGVVAAMDLLKPWTGDYGSPERDDVIAVDVMTQDVEAIEHWRTLPDAAARMTDRHIHALLVLLANGEISGELASRPIMATRAGAVAGVNIPIGLVSATDIVREIGKRGAGTVASSHDVNSAAPGGLHGVESRGGSGLRAV
jgi:CBS domain-containing protein